MDIETPELDRLQTAYKAAVEAWIDAIRQEEALVAKAPDSVDDLDKWEAAHFAEDDLRGKVKTAKNELEDALRRKFFDF